MTHNCTFLCNGKTSKQLQDEYDTTIALIGMADELADERDKVFTEFHRLYPCFELISDYNETGQDIEVVCLCSDWKL